MVLTVTFQDFYECVRLNGYLMEFFFFQLLLNDKDTKTIQAKLPPDFQQELQPCPWDIGGFLWIPWVYQQPGRILHP